MAKSFKTKIKDDFKAVDLQPAARDAAKSKAFPGARLIPLTEVHPDPEQPRKTFNRERMGELRASIEAKGIIEPLTVRKSDEGFCIVVGERRYCAAESLGIEMLPCVVRELDDDECLEIQMVENLQRENLNPVEEARAFKKLSDRGKTQQEIASLVGMSQPYISQSLKILKLPDDVLEKAVKDEIPKERLLSMLKAKPERKRPKIKPWTWKPESKDFTISIKFRKTDAGKEELIKALESALESLRS